MGNDSKQSDTAGLTEAEVLKRLGNQIEEFGPSIVSLIVGYVFGILLGIAGLVILFFVIKALIETGGKLPFETKKGASWISVGFGSMLGIGAIVGGLFLVRYVRSLFEM